MEERLTLYCLNGETLAENQNRRCLRCSLSLLALSLRRRVEVRAMRLMTRYRFAIGVASFIFEIKRFSIPMRVSVTYSKVKTIRCSFLPRGVTPLISIDNYLFSPYLFILIWFRLREYPKLPNYP